MSQMAADLINIHSIYTCMHRGVMSAEQRQTSTLPLRQVSNTSRHKNTHRRIHDRCHRNSFMSSKNETASVARLFCGELMTLGSSCTTRHSDGLQLPMNSSGCPTEKLILTEMIGHRQKENFIGILVHTATKLRTRCTQHRTHIL